MKKGQMTRMFVMLCATVIAFSTYVTPPALATYAVTRTESLAISHSQENFEISPRTEETTWCYRIHNDKLQRRLWSNTRGIWLTDWMDC